VSSSPIQIRSFRVCFRLERRIHKIDRWRIPLPFGVPLRGVGYAAAALLALSVVGRLPILGDLLAVLPTPIRLVVLPVGVAYAMTRWEIDGRAAHASARAWFGMRTAPKRIAAFRPAEPTGPVTLGDVTIARDDRGARLRPAVIVGPARMIVRYPVRARGRRGTLQLERQAGPALFRGKQVTLQAGQRAVVR
jgi:hypothetical protein